MKKNKLLIPIVSIVALSPIVSIVSCGEEEEPQPEPIPDYGPLTFEKNGTSEDADPTLTYAIEGALENLHMQYKYDEGEWQDWAVNEETGPEVLTIDDGQKLYVQNLSDTLSISEDNYLHFEMTEEIKSSGGANSLVNYAADEIPQYSFYKLFESCKTLISAPNLPTIKINLGGYECMFQNCISLTQPPIIWAEEADSLACYAMFRTCTSLIDAPEIKITTFVKGNKHGEEVFECMFENCESLVNPPETLPANTLYWRDYAYMFRRCKSLKKTPHLVATELFNNCYECMFESCTNLKVVQDSGTNMIFDFRTRTVGFPPDAMKNIFNNTHTPISVETGHYYCYIE